jgi:hypothetical protein
MMAMGIIASVRFRAVGLMWFAGVANWRDRGDAMAGNERRAAEAEPGREGSRSRNGRGKEERDAGMGGSGCDNAGSGRRRRDGTGGMGAAELKAKAWRDWERHGRGQCHVRTGAAEA